MDKAFFPTVYQVSGNISAVAGTVCNAARSLPEFLDADHAPRASEEKMSGVAAFLGLFAAILIAAGIFVVSPVSLVVAAILEMSGVALAVAFFGLTDGT